MENTTKRSPLVRVIDELGPEDNAMLQALYSRSAESVETHLEKVHAAGSGKFMETWYIGYGHHSIGDCGSTTVFIEGVSELAAKAIQDWPLYSGQQTSTRYIDFSRQALIDPLGSAESAAILADWMELYQSSQEPLLAHLREMHPPAADDDPVIHEKALRARTFDILRAFLPAGVTTQLSWHGNLRQMRDQLDWLAHHPLGEVRELAASIRAALAARYPHSFPVRTDNPWLARVVAESAYLPPQFDAEFRFQTTIRQNELEQYRSLLRERPRHSELPRFLAELGQLSFGFMLDYGSFRDVQRHRNGICRMPLLTSQLGFERWYMEQLPDGLRSQIGNRVHELKGRIAALDTTPELRQYYLALGFRVSCRLSCGLPAAVYLVEMRSGATVHPTLRRVAHRMHEALVEAFPSLSLHVDLSADALSLRRGKQDIVARDALSKSPKA